MEYKGYSIEGDGSFGYKHIKAIGRGSVHISLRGAYTNHTFAMKAIDAFLATKEGKPNGKAESSK